MKKMLRFVLLLIIALGIAGGAGVWKVRQLANSKILIKDETIFTLKAGSFTGIKSLTVLVCSSGYCVLSLIYLTSRPVPTALRPA